MSILWVTSFSRDIFAATGHALVESFLASGSEGVMALYTEGLESFRHEQLTSDALDDDPFLRDFLRQHGDVIPREQGGSVIPPECACPGGPYGVHSREHTLPCVGFWFCRNAYRWLRKVLSIKRASEAHGGDAEWLIWVDADCLFTRRVTRQTVAEWCPADADCFYLKSRRSEIETGVVGYRLSAGGLRIIDAMFDRYASGAFRTDSRWDDCRQLGQAIELASARYGSHAVDLARALGEHETVVQHSPLGAYLSHRKGFHRRTGVLR